MQIEEICVLLQNQLIFRPVQHLILNDRLNLKQRARNRPRTLVDSKFWATPSISILKPTFCQIWAIESGNGLYDLYICTFLVHVGAGGHPGHPGQLAVRFVVAGGPRAVPLPLGAEI